MTKKERIEKAIEYYELKLEKQVSNFRACAKEYQVENIIAFLPNMIFCIQETQNRLYKLRSQLELLNLLSGN